jgi:hypothetical protein
MDIYLNSWKGPRSAVLVALALLTLIQVAEAGEPNWAQRAVINVDHMARDVHRTFFKTDRQQFFDKFMPVDDFRIYAKPNIGKSLSKSEVRYTIGFKFTF